MSWDGCCTRRQAVVLGAGAAGAAVLAGCSGAGEAAGSGGATATGFDGGLPDVEAILAGMSLDEKVSQLVIPSLAQSGTDKEPGAWMGEADVTVLSDVPALSEALGRHQYGGLILYAANVEGTEQLCRLTDALQGASAAGKASAHVPLLMCADGEGGVVVRLTMGTRMTGAMAVGATGENAEDNAYETGAILGGELAAVGVNVDFAPDADVNSNPANPVIGVRSFGDGPTSVARLACAMGRGVSDAGVAPCYKHFPGHGDTGTDSHIGTASVGKTLEELRACELVPFVAAVDAGADLIMTAHITCPELDDEVSFADGSVGHLPATMSGAIITGILREELGYDGVVVTDALTMDAIATAHLAEGEEGSAEYAANVAERVLNAGVDLLLSPRDLVSDAGVDFFDEYIGLICEKVEAGVISQERIDESVRRVLRLKEAHGILGLPVGGAGGGSDAGREDELGARIAEAQAVVGSAEHHEAELLMAREAVTLVKNGQGPADTAAPLPLGPAGSYVLLVRTAYEAALARFAVGQLQEEGLLPGDARVVDLIGGEATGEEDSACQVTIDCYYDLDTGEAVHSEGIDAALASADAVICETTTWGASALGAGSVQRQAIEEAMAATFSAGGAFVQLSDNLPYDAAVYTSADAQVLAYMSAGMGVDPTDHSGGSDAPAYNANFVAALEAIFGGFDPMGTLPVNVPEAHFVEGGEVEFGEEVLYPRGWGLSYT